MTYIPKNVRGRSTGLSFSWRGKGGKRGIEGWFGLVRFGPVSGSQQKYEVEVLWICTCFFKFLTLLCASIASSFVANLVCVDRVGPCCCGCSRNNEEREHDLEVIYLCVRFAYYVCMFFSLAYGSCSPVIFVFFP